MAKLPTRTTTVEILVYEGVSISLALLMRDILERANQLLGRRRFAVTLAGRPGLRVLRAGAVTIHVRPASAEAHYLVVPPLAPGGDPFVERPAESRRIARRFRNGTTIASACLGSLIVAQSGILDGKEATTHWAWMQRAAERFPTVRWNVTKMICHSGRIITAGGYLGAVDLTLAIVERTCSRSLSRELGRLLLADSARQNQSIYATTLVMARSEDPRLQKLEQWLETHLSSTITVEAMADVCGLSPRTFHREFLRAYGYTPKKFLQLKRIEKMRQLLRKPDLSIEQALQHVGVSDVPSFRKVFQRELGLSPAQYRRRIRAER